MQTKLSKNQKLNAILIGTGGQGARRGSAIKLANGWNLSGVFDTDIKRAGSMAMKWNCKCYSEVQSGITEKDVDVVVIATPPASHDDLIEMAIDAGKHVLCEKPLTIDPESAQRLAGKAESNGLVLATGLNHRFYKPVLDAIDLIGKRELGELIQINGRIGQKPVEQDLNGWLGNNAISGGGVLTDNGSHLIDLIQMFAGPVNQVKNIEMQWHESRKNIEVFAKADLTGVNGIKSILKCSWINSDEPYLGIELICEKGTTRITAFPCRLEIIPTGGKKTVWNYWNERILMKFLGLKSPGLERSLIRELDSLRNTILRTDFKPSEVSTATGYDGARIAKVITLIREANPE